MMDGSGGMFFGTGFMWIFWLLIIVMVVAVIKIMMGGSAQREDSLNETPLSILKKRYARGEIDQEEYREKRRELER